MKKHVIYKYTLPLPMGATFNKAIKIHHGARVISAHDQDGLISVWALVDPDVIETIEHTFLVIPTGHIFEGDLSKFVFVGTVIQLNGRFVVHIWREKSALESLNELLP